MSGSWEDNPAVWTLGQDLCWAVFRLRSVGWGLDSSCSWGIWGVSLVALPCLSLGTGEETRGGWNILLTLQEGGRGQIG